MVPPRVQTFALELSSQGAPVSLLQEIADRVFTYAGCVSAPVDDLAAALRQAAAGGTFGGVCRCDLQMRANQDRLEILVSANGGRIWQGSCPRTTPE